MHNDHEVLRKDDMDIVGELFGIRFIKHLDDISLIELYIEDDENYFLKCKFHPFWLKDLLTMLNNTKDGMIEISTYDFVRNNGTT